jgi:hypothetical protein
VAGAAPAHDAASVPDPAPAPAVIPIVLSTLAGRQPYRPLARRKTTRGTRARENGTLTWTARGEPGDDAAPP